jgi:cytochrome bd ubiquinol oxidase subunit II
MTLADFWFVLIAVLWIGFFFLEGFDFGVGILEPILGRTDTERRQIINTIGPVWDGNEVWLLVGGAAIFAAFPTWYASLFSAAYLPLLLIVLGLICRGMVFEYRSKHPTMKARNIFDWMLSISSLLVPLLLGVAWAAMVHGVPINAQGEFTGNTLMSFVNPYSLVGGLTMLAYCISHGATYLSIKTTGPVQERAAALAKRASLVTFLLGVAFVVWTGVGYNQNAPWVYVAGALGVIGLAGAFLTNAKGQGKLAFWADLVGVLGVVSMIFIALYPNALPSTTNPKFSLTIEAAASNHYTLKLMTIIALCMVPIILVYQAWSFWVFRQRIKTEDIPATPVVEDAKV